MKKILRRPGKGKKYAAKSCRRDLNSLGRAVVVQFVANTYLTSLAAVHVLSLEFVRREEVREAVDQRDVGPVQPPREQVERPREPSSGTSATARAAAVRFRAARVGLLVSESSQRFRGGNGQREVLRKEGTTSEIESPQPVCMHACMHACLESLRGHGHPVAGEALDRRDKFSVENVGDDASVDAGTSLLKERYWRCR